MKAGHVFPCIPLIFTFSQCKVYQHFFLFFVGLVFKSDSCPFGFSIGWSCIKDVEDHLGNDIYLYIHKKNWIKAQINLNSIFSFHLLYHYKPNSGRFFEDTVGFEGLHSSKPGRMSARKNFMKYIVNIPPKSDPLSPPHFVLTSDFFCFHSLDWKTPCSSSAVLIQWSNVLQPFSGANAARW